MCKILESANSLQGLGNNPEIMIIIIQSCSRKTVVIKVTELPALNPSYFLLPHPITPPLLHCISHLAVLVMLLVPTHPHPLISIL